MPLLKFDLIQGRDDEQLLALLDSAHAAMVQAFEVPLSDRYQCVTQHRPNELVIHDTGLNLPRSNNVVLLTVAPRPDPSGRKETSTGSLSPTCRGTAACVRKTWWSASSRTRTRTGPSALARPSS